MLVKSTPGVNFINILCAAFAPVGLRQQKYKPKMQAQKKLCAQLTQVKAVCRTLVKSTPGGKIGKKHLPQTRQKSEQKILTIINFPIFYRLPKSEIFNAVDFHPSIQILKMLSNYRYYNISNNFNTISNIFICKQVIYKVIL